MERIITLITLLLLLTAKENWEVSPETFPKEDKIPHYDLKSLPHCPENFTLKDKICYITLKETQFPPNCPYKNVLGFEAYYPELSESISEPVWVPVRMKVSEKSGILPMRWIEFSTLYNTFFNKKYQKKDSEKYLDSQCMLAVSKDDDFLAVPCEEKHTAICAYQVFFGSQSDVCKKFINENCYRSDFEEDSKCYCIDENTKQEGRKLAEFIKPYQNNVFLELAKNTDKQCTIGLNQNTTNKRYFWINSNTEISYTFWANDADLESNIGSNFYAATDSGWILSETEPDCVLIEEDINDPGEMVLTLSEKSGSMYLVVKNPKKLKSELSLFCFTNGAKLSLIYRYVAGSALTKIEEESSEDEAHYHFQTLKHGPAHYWCEGITNFDTNVISNTVLYDPYKDGSEFVVILKVEYWKGTNPLYYENMDFFTFLVDNAFTEESDEILSKYSSKIITISGLNEEDPDNRNLELNIHFSSSYQITAENVEKETENLSTAIQRALSFITAVIIKFDGIFNTKFCNFQITIENDAISTWPTTKIGDKTLSKELCFIDNSLYYRSCNGDFLHGARWSPIEGTCTVHNTQSDVTSNLIDILFKGAVEHIDDLVTIIKDSYRKFKPIDVLLVAEILTSSVQDLDGVSLNDILDTILNIDRSILNEAERAFSSSAKLLGIIDIFTSRRNEDEIVVPATINNVEILKLVCKFSCVITLQQNEDDTIIKFLDNVLDIDSLLLTNIESAVIITSQAELNHEVFVTIFKNDALFMDESSDFDFAGTIFSVRLIDINEDSSLLIQVLEKVDNTEILYDCSIWDDSLSALSTWDKVNISTSLEGFSICDYDLSENYLRLTARSTPNICLEGKCNNGSSINDTLNDLLHGNKTLQEITEGLLNVSSSYDILGVNDIYLVSEIIEKVSNETAIDLDALAEIISNLNDVDRNTLSRSQCQKLSTDRILHNADKIFTKHNNYTKHVEKMKKNFVIVISDIKDSNFGGLVIKTDDSDSLMYESIFNDFDFDDVINMEDVQSAVILSRELKNQLIDLDSKVIVTVFPKDSLFNDNRNDSKFISKIFGLILTNITEPYKGGVSVIHQISKNGSNDCSYWKYDHIHHSKGFWQKDLAGEEYSSMFIHCQYNHTTHFALLIIDEDKYSSESEYLDMITSINCALSLFGLSIIALTAILYKRWRMNTGNQLLMNFVLAIALQIATFYSSSIIKQKLDLDDALFCTIIGIALHYSLISQFCWMFIIAILQFKRFVEVFTAPPKYVLLKACLCGWILPLLPVGCVYFLDKQNYVDAKSGLCYPSGLGLYLGVWLPIAIIVAINFVIFVYIMCSVANRKTECADTVSNNDILFQWRLAVLLFFMLGLTWGFGFLSELDFGIIFVYLFCFFATLQGFIMFLFFIVFNKNTRYLYYHSIKNLCFKSYY